MSRGGMTFHMGQNVRGALRLPLYKLDYFSRRRTTNDSERGPRRAV